MVLFIVARHYHFKNYDCKHPVSSSRSRYIHSGTWAVIHSYYCTVNFDSNCGVGGVGLSFSSPVKVNYDATISHNFDNLKDNILIDLYYTIHSNVRIPALDWYRQIDYRSSKRGDTIRGYMLSLVNTIVQSIWAAYKLSNHADDDMRSNLFAVTTLLSYLLYDTYTTRNVWLEEKTNAIHHVLSISIIFGFLALRGSPLFHIVPRLMIIEFSTIFVNSSWLLREAGAAAGLCQL